MKRLTLDQAYRAFATNRETGDRRKKFKVKACIWLHWFFCDNDLKPKGMGYSLGGVFFKKPDLIEFTYSQTRHVPGNSRRLIRSFLKEQCLLRKMK